MTDTRFASLGGFMPPPRTSLPSPAPSTASSRAAAGLPHPRSKPLVPGSRKEDYAREYVSQRLLHISRRYVKKHGIPDPADLVAAYASFDEVCKDLEEVVDVLWFSGTPSLQVPYLLNVALAITEYLPAFPASPRPTFALLKKLDHCFASLLRGRDVRTGESLPGFERGLSKGMTRTDMVRCKSLADQTRMQIALKMSNEADVDTSFIPDEDPAINTTRSTTRKRKASDLVETEKGEEREEDDEEEEEDDDDSDTNDGPEAYPNNTIIPPRRQKTESPTTQRIDSTAVNNEGSMGSPGSSGIALTKDHATGGAQFHWAVEEDSEDEDEDEDEDGDGNPTTNNTNDRQSHRMTPPVTGPTGHNQGPPPGIGTTLHPQDVDNQEEEDEDELIMSVAKVYEKTIVQLGKTLGQTLVDE